MSPTKPPSSPTISAALPRPMAPRPAKSSGSGRRNISRARRLTRRARPLRKLAGGGPAFAGPSLRRAAGRIAPAVALGHQPIAPKPVARMIAASTMNPRSFGIERSMRSLSCGLSAPGT